MEGIKEPLYYRTQDQPTLEAALDGGAHAGDPTADSRTSTGDPLAGDPMAVRLMAPLDNLLWERRMLKALFDFEYTWEVYVPADKRRYGYYVLPVLAGDRFIARCEPVMDRKRQALVLKNWWWEPGVDAAAWAAPAQQAVERLAAVFGARTVEGEVVTM